MNEKKICACVGARTRDTQKSKEHYEENFIPAGWNLEYTCLDQPEAQTFIANDTTFGEKQVP